MLIVRTGSEPTDFGDRFEATSVNTDRSTSQFNPIPHRHRPITQRISLDQAQGRQVDNNPTRSSSSGMTANVWGRSSPTFSVQSYQSGHRATSQPNSYANILKNEKDKEETSFKNTITFRYPQGDRAAS